MADGARIVFKNDKKLRAAFKKLGDRLPQATEQAMRMSTLFLQGRVQERKLSGQVLKVQTGRLRSSINTRVKKLGPLQVIGIIGTNVVYARAHEYGYPPRNLKARPFLRPTFNENTQRVKAIFRQTIVDFAKRTVREGNA